MILLISLLAAVIVFLILYAIFLMKSTKRREVHNRLQNIGRLSSASNADVYWRKQMNRSFKDRIIQPVVDKVAENLAAVAPSGLRSRVEELVDASGGFYGRGMTGFVLFCFASTAIYFLFAVWYCYDRDMSLFSKLIRIVLFTGVGVYFPFFWLKRLIRQRQKAILQSMPDVLDLLCVSVQAGLGFDGALGKVTAKLKGPLIDEFERLLQELRMGVTRRQALTRLARRCGIQEMQLFTAAIIQADKLGVGMAQTLEIQSGNMREARRQRAKEEAAKLPVKILFPTMIFIFPVMFVVVLGPAIVSLINSMGK